MIDRRFADLGPIPPDWSLRFFGDVVEKQAQPVEVTLAQEYREIGIRSHGRGIFHKDPVTGLELGDKRVFWVKPDCLTFNIVFAWEGATAVTGRAESGMIASHRFPMYSPREPPVVDVEYLRRFFQSALGVRLLGKASPGGAGRNRTLNQRLLGEVPLRVPPLNEQRKIAAVLASVDATIDATQAVVDQLQVVKRAITAQVLTRGLPGKHTTFKRTEIGEVPEAWEVAPLAKCVREPIRNGYSPVCPTKPTGRWILHLGAVTFDGLDPQAVKPAPLGDARVDAASVEPGDVLVSRSNTRERVGLAGLYRGTPSPCSYPDLLMRVRPNLTLRPDFLEAILLSGRGRDYFSRAARGTSASMVKINRQILEDFLIPMPSPSEQKEVMDVLAAFGERRRIEIEVLGALRGLKSALMAVLLTGELRVPKHDEVAA